MGSPWTASRTSANSFLTASDPRIVWSLPVWRPNRPHRGLLGRQLSGKHIDFYDWGVETIYARAGTQIYGSRWVRS